MFARPPKGRRNTGRQQAGETTAAVRLHSGRQSSCISSAGKCWRPGWISVSLWNEPSSTIPCSLFTRVILMCWSFRKLRKELRNSSSVVFPSANFWNSICWEKYLIINKHDNGHYVAHNYASRLLLNQPEIFSFSCFSDRSDISLLFNDAMFHRPFYGWWCCVKTGLYMYVYIVYCTTVAIFLAYFVYSNRWQTTKWWRPLISLYREYLRITKSHLKSTIAVYCVLKQTLNKQIEYKRYFYTRKRKKIHTDGHNDANQIEHLHHTLALHVLSSAWDSAKHHGHCIFRLQNQICKQIKTWNTINGLYIYKLTNVFLFGLDDASKVFQQPVLHC